MQGKISYVDFPVEISVNDYLTLPKPVSLLSSTRLRMETYAVETFGNAVPMAVESISIILMAGSGEWRMPSLVSGWVY